MPDVPALQLRWGAVAFIDALGFKGIWRRHDPAAVISALRNARDVARADAEFHNIFLNGGWYDGLNVRFLSDTVIIMGALPPGPPPSRALPITRRDVIEKVALAAAFIVVQAAKRKPELAYRGCIAAGDCLAADEFVIGEAIDLAAEGEREAEAAIIWLHDSARGELPDPFDSAANPGLVEWEVPLKKSPPVKTLIVNPLGLCHVPGWENMAGTAGLVDDLQAALLEPLTSPKREATSAALAAGAAATRAHFAARGEPPKMRSLLDAAKAMWEKPTKL